MKKFFSLAVAILTILCGCSNDQNDDYAGEITDADIFVASEQFQTHQTQLKNCARQVYKIWKGMTRSERMEFDDLVKQATKAKDYNELMCIEKKLSQILNFDYSGMLADLYENRQQLYEGVKFNNESLLKAIQRYNKKNRFLPMTRSWYEQTESDCQNEALHEYDYVYYFCMNENNGYEYYEIGYGNNSASPDDRIWARLMYDQISRSCSDQAALRQMIVYNNCVMSLH